jgi:hypothetical protein
MATLTLQQGVSSYTGTTDNHIFQFRSYNSGANTELYIGAGTGGSPSTDRKYSLIKFDLSGQGFTGTETVTSATLKLKFTAFDNGANTKTHAIAALRRPFGEGVGTGKDGSVALTGESTWSEYQKPSTWTTVGAQDTTDDRYNADSSTSVPMTTTAGTVITWDVTTSVQNFINSTWTNNGWVLYTTSGDTANGSSKYHSRNAATATDRPILEIVYTTGAGATATAAFFLMLMD